MKYSRNLAQRFMATLLLACGTVMAQDGITVSSEPALVTAGDPLKLVIKGTAASGCGIALVRMDVQGSQITITLRDGVTPGRFCTTALQPFTLNVNPLAAGSNASAGTYRVSINYVDGDDATRSRLIGFGLVPVIAAGALPILPETGNWAHEQGGEHATSGSGVGFSVDRQRDTVVAIGNFYASDGTPEWYFESGKLNGHVLSADYYMVKGGQTLFGAYRAPQEIRGTGQILFEFMAPTRGTAWVTQPTDQGFPATIKLMPISIARFGFGYGVARSALAGDWQLVAGTDAKLLRFVASSASGNSVVVYTAEDYRLSCTLDARRPESLPNDCELSKALQPVANFSRIGFEKLSGSDRNQRAVYLFRVP
jgi:hypothetical protein